MSPAMSHSKMAGTMDHRRWGGDAESNKLATAWLFSWSFQSVGSCAAKTKTQCAAAISREWVWCGSIARIDTELLALQFPFSGFLFCSVTTAAAVLEFSLRANKRAILQWRFRQERVMIRALRAEKEFKDHPSAVWCSRLFWEVVA